MITLQVTVPNPLLLNSLKIINNNTVISLAGILLFASSFTVMSLVQSTISEGETKSCSLVLLDLCEI
jgi:hypothetical protein